MAIRLICKKCGHRHFIPIAKNNAKECSKCKYIESATTNTLFHKLKFSLRKAFHIIFEMSFYNQGYSSYDIAKRYGIQQKTAWSIMQKVRYSHANDESALLLNHVLVSDFVFGHKLNNKKNSAKKSNVCKFLCLATIDNHGKINGIKTKMIKNFSAKEIRPILDGLVLKDVKLTTSTWSAYKSLRNSFNINQLTPEADFFKPSKVIMQNFFRQYLKIHIRYSAKHFQKYLD